MGTTSYPETVAEVIESIGAAGQRLNDINAVEAGAGNISACFNWPVDLDDFFNTSRDIDLPYDCPAWPGTPCWSPAPAAGYASCPATRATTWARSRCTRVAGPAPCTTARRATSTVRRRSSTPTSPCTRTRCANRGIPFHAVIHAQPPHLTLLSHIADYQSTAKLNAAILRWEPETIVQLREGVGYCLHVPGSDELMAANVANLRKHQIVLWAKHGVMARSDTSPLKACDRIEYAETGALYEYLNLSSGGRAQA